MDSDARSMVNSQNSLATNIPLPRGSPPPMHQQRQQQSMPIFGSNSRPMTFESLAKKTQENVVESTLHQYGPGVASPVTNPMSHIVYNSATMSLMQQQQQQQQQQQLHLQQQQMQQQRLHQQQMQHRAQLSFQRPNQPYQLQQQQNMTNLNPALRQTTINQMSMARPPVYINNSVPVHCQPTQVPTYHISPSPNSSSGPSFNPSSSVNTISTSASTVITSQPDVPISPPLDIIRGSGHPNNITLTTPPHQADQPQQRDEPAIQKVDLLTHVKENWEKWTLNQMIQEHKSLGQQLEKSQSERAQLEKEIKDIQRKNPFQNVELNPIFIRKKSELIDMGRKCEDIHQAMKFVAEKSDKKYGRKLDNANLRQPLQNAANKRFQRAKMSTAAPSPSVSKEDPKDKNNVLLDLRDDCVWCQACDVHFKNLKEYCIHLHKREHSMNAETTSQPPWRHPDHKRQLGRFETFSKFKSMCSKVNDVVDFEFKVTDLDAVLNPSIKSKEELKALNLNRERKNFDNDDKLFTYKGYDEIIPITGYYCKLCDRTLCDDKEVENHLKGWLHNYEHTKSVALQASHERDFRVKMEKSLKLVRESEKTNSSAPKATKETTKESSSKPPTVRERSPVASSNGLSSHWSARLPYKKPTSKIVDEHDVIAEKFDKRKEREKDKDKEKEREKEKDTSTQPTKKIESSKSSKLSSPPSKTRPAQRRTVPEIVPVSENQPAAALKRLKRDRINEQSKEQSKTKSIDEKDDYVPPAVVESSTDEEPEPVIKNHRDMIASAADDSDIQILKEVHLDHGDPDSPFPNLDIFVTGNYPLSALKDERLSREAVVKMNGIDLDDYKEMLLESSSLWARVHKLMTKKEPGEFQKNLETVTVTEPCYFGQDGEAVPVSVDRDSSDEGEKEEQFQIHMLKDFFCS
jgi:hypothetical protein